MSIDHFFCSDCRIFHKQRYKRFYFKSHLPPKRFPKYLCHRMAQFWSYNCLVVFLFIFYSQTMVLYIIHLLRTIWFYYFNNHRVLNSILVQCGSIGKCQLGTNDHIFNGTLLIRGQVFFHAMTNWQWCVSGYEPLNIIRPL